MESVHVTYMGTKRQLAHEVSSLMRDEPCGPMLDLFAGMGSVGRAVGTSRQVWSNDFQHFSNLVTRLTFSATAPLQITPIVRTEIRKRFSNHIAQVQDYYSALLFVESKAIEKDNWEVCAELFEWRIENQASIVDKGVNTTFSDRYSFCYVGMKQAIEVDAMRSAIASAKYDQCISSEQADWLVLALCKAISKCSTSPGHFAQPSNRLSGDEG